MADLSVSTPHWSLHTKHIYQLHSPPPPAEEDKQGWIAGDTWVLTIRKVSFSFGPSGVCALHI